MSYYTTSAERMQAILAEVDKLGKRDVEIAFLLFPVSPGMALRTILHLRHGVLLPDTEAYLPTFVTRLREVAR